MLATLWHERTRPGMLWCYATAGVTFRYDRFSVRARSSTPDVASRSPVREAVLAARRLNRSLRRLERSQVTSGDIRPLGRVLRRTRRLVEGVTASLEGRSEIAGDPVA